MTLLPNVVLRKNPLVPIMVVHTEKKKKKNRDEYQTPQAIALEKNGHADSVKFF